MSEPAPPGFVRGELLRDAWEVAVGAHAGQTRTSDETPYVHHPAEVAELLWSGGLDDEELLAAAILHDVVEDSAIELDEIRARFGQGVASLVEAMTEDERIEPYEERKLAHRRQVEAAGPRVAAIYAADKLAKLREMRSLYAAIGERASERFKAPVEVRVRLWRGDLEMAERVVPELGLVGELRAELEAFEAQREGAR